jgi:NitT/TauT family transport system ATP-binding protein
VPLSDNQAIALKGVHRVFHSEREGDVPALVGIDLTVATNEFVALLGPSGCGKSTLLRLLAGLDQPDRGTVRVAAARVAMVFQDAHLLPWRDVLGNVELPLELLHQPPALRRQRALAAIAQVALGDAARRYPAELSGGMRMRVSLARALVTEPRLLLLDEPFAALDELTRMALDDELRRVWREAGLTVVFVTHSIAEAAYLAERVIVLSKRPAHIVLDHRVALAAQRSAQLRADAAFARETGILQDALRQGAALT